ncbi:hypothetical protein O181_038741 [Austropuccinia psidii MF-1]|uniref:Uncharacterized protein n=1 Tax=Austropuccinia psidii MF-1 TaxID=1389203 RepID=A0A9Q3DEJ9_9BASI|nr:hypothetical protein [Austropuccinia psidii MF-1]
MHMILKLLQPPQDDTTMRPPLSALTTTAYNPYPPAALSRYASDATLNPLKPNTLSTAYHPYAQVLDL